MKALKNILDFVTFLLTGKGEIANDAVMAGAVDFSGQGRNKYGE